VNLETVRHERYESLTIKYLPLVEVMRDKYPVGLNRVSTSLYGFCLLRHFSRENIDKGYRQSE